MNKESCVCVFSLCGEQKKLKGKERERRRGRNGKKGNTKQGDCAIRTSQATSIYLHFLLLGSFLFCSLSSDFLLPCFASQGFLDFAYFCKIFFLPRLIPFIPLQSFLFMPLKLPMSVVVCCSQKVSSFSWVSGDGERKDANEAYRKRHKSAGHLFQEEKWPLQEGFRAFCAL